MSVPEPVVDAPRDALGRRPRAPTSSAARSATRCSAGRRRTGTSRPTRCPSRRRQLFPDAVYENGFGTVAVRRRRHEYRDHDVPERPRLRRLPAPAPGRVRDVARGRPRPPRLHGQRDGLGGDASADGASAARGARRSVRRPRRRRRAGPAGRRRARDPLRGGRAADGPGRPARGDARVRASSRTTLAAIRDQAPLVAHLSGERIAAELGKLLGGRPAVRRAAAPAPTPGSSTRSRPSSPPSAASPRTRSEGEDLWDHTLAHGRRRARPPGRPPGGAPPRHRQARDRRPTATSTATRPSAPSRRARSSTASTSRAS